jgi:hypothetical protein
MRESILKRYPNLKEEDIVFVDLSNEGGGIELSVWNSFETKPTMEQINQWNEEDRLESVVEQKKNELSQLCTQEINNGFTYTIDGIEYRFSYDSDAQSNFREARDAIKDGLISEVKWTAYRTDTGERVRILLNGKQLQEMRVIQLEQKDSIIEKYNNILLNQLYVAKTSSEAEAIGWDD